MKNPDDVAIEMLKLLEGATGEEVLAIIARFLYHVGFILQG